MGNAQSGQKIVHRGAMHQVWQKQGTKGQDMNEWRECGAARVAPESLTFPEKVLIL